MSESHHWSGESRLQWRRWLKPIFIVLALVVIRFLVAFTMSPGPGASMIRAAFGRNDRRMIAALQEHIPDDVTSFIDQPYREGDPDAKLDVFVPDAAVERGERLPTVVWMHGGAWVAGSREDWRPYFMVLASRGYTVVAIGYSLGPNQIYPTALHQVNDALGYVQDNAEQLHIDPDRIVMAGDSAGAQITSQYAAIVTNQNYAAEVGIEPSLAPERLRGVILYCGIYDFGTFFGASGLIGWGVRTSIWAYTGNRGTTFGANPALAEMSSINHVTAAFPPAFISGGNTDPLTEGQSKPLAVRLNGLGVAVDTLFFPEDHEPGQSHEYQFKLDSEEGRQALDQSVLFLEQVVAGS
jgi:acetyl esterase